MLLKNIGTATRRLLPKNHFARSVFVLAGGTAAGQALVVFASPLLTRLYTPEHFGLLAIYAGLLSLVTVVVTLRYQIAIPLPESDQEAANLTVLCLCIVAAMTGLSAIIAYLCGQYIADLMNVPKLADHAWVFPLSVLFVGIYQVFHYWAIRNNKFSRIARIRIWQSFTTVIIQIAGFKLGGVSLVLGHAAGQGMGGLTLAKSVFGRAQLRGCNLHALSSAARRYRDFPLYSTWGALFNAVGQQLAPIMFAILFSAGAAGLYALAHRVLTLPMSLIGQSAGQVFLSSGAEAYREGRIGPLVKSIHDKLTQIAMPPALVLILVGPDLFGLIFGEAWRQAGDFGRWMAPWLYVVFVTSPLSTLYEIMERQRLGVLFQSILLSARLVAIGIGGWWGDLMMAVILFSLSSALCWVGFLAWITLASGNGLALVIAPTLRAFIVSFACVSPLLAAPLWHTGETMWVVVMAMAGLLVLGRYWMLLFR